MLIVTAHYSKLTRYHEPRPWSWGQHHDTTNGDSSGDGARLRCMQRPGPFLRTQSKEKAKKPNRVRRRKKAKDDRRQKK